MKRLFIFLAFATGALSQSGSTGTRDTAFEDQPGVALSNDRLTLTVMKQGSTIASIVMADDPDKMNPMWNPVRLAHEQGRQAQFNGSAGHFVCVDGFGPPSVEESAAGLPQHGEAHVAKYEVTTGRDGNGSSITMTAKLPIVQENFTRTFRIVAGENVVYVDSQLENLLGFDRPVNWAEHATLSAPFLKPGAVTIALSGNRSQNRPYVVNAPRGGRGAQAQRRLVSGKDFTWPIAPGLDGKPVDMSIIPDDPHYLDHATTLMDPTRKLEWVAALNTERRMIYGYVFRREEYPWLQHWGNYPAVAQLVRGMEFGTQPYDLPRRDTIDARSMFDTPTYRWLAAKSKIESHFVLFFAHVPDGFQKVDDVKLESGQITIEDRVSQKRVTLAASRGL